MTAPRPIPFVPRFGGMPAIPLSETARVLVLVAGGVFVACMWIGEQRQLLRARVRTAARQAGWKAMEGMLS